MTDKVKPIIPDEILAEKEAMFPNAVFEAFNEIITEKFYQNYATFKLKDVIALMVKKGLNREEIFEKGWFHIEDIYRANGWKVHYDRPAFNESYDANFTFNRSL